MLRNGPSHDLHVDTGTVSATLTFDPAEYMHFLVECDWTEAQKEEFVQELWKIVQGFVDLGFGIHPVQQVTAHVGLVAESDGMLGFSEISNKPQTEAARMTVLTGAEDS